MYSINYGPQLPTPMNNNQATPAQNPQAAYFQQPVQANAAANNTSALNLNPMSSPLGFNMGTANLALGGIATIGNLWAAFQAQKMAKEQFGFQKGLAETNLANQIKTYNTNLSDRITARAHMQGSGQEYVRDYLSNNSLKDERK
jgi:hypothetical protein